ncbi:MAG: lipoyl synthase, partial [Clostridiales Family XIII bacterium]|nr:lipoyl synthase [Clostridiales Family XIII bacterium]
KIVVETLIPDFKGDKIAIKKVIDSGAEIISHNMETVKELYSTVRPQAIYNRSLEVIKEISNSTAHSKSGVMLGLGESEKEVLTLLEDLCKVSCEFLTIGQYLAPSEKHHPVIDYITPDKFSWYEKKAKNMGFHFVKAGVFVRSSYKAAEAVL